MFLKNYTSTVPMDRTVSKIESLLAEFGAKSIGKNYEQGQLVSLTFQIEVEGRDVLVRLPSNPKAVFDALKRECKRPHSGTMDRLKEQSIRTAWRIQQDWLEIELTKIKLNQTEPLQAFLSYVWDGKQTFYQSLVQSGFKAMIPEKCS